MANEQFVIRLGVNSSGVASGINSAVGQIQRLYNGVTQVAKGFLALSAVRWSAGVIRDSIQFGSELTDLAARSRITVEELQGIQHAADQTGASVEGITNGMKNMAKAQIDAIKGNRELQAVFARYGKTVQDLKNQKPSDIFKQVGDRMGKSPASALITDDAATLLGRNSDELLPAFRRGLSSAADEAERLGLILETKVTDELDRAGDEIEIMTKKWKVFKAEVTATTLSNLRGNITEILSFIHAGQVGTAVGKAAGGGPLGKIMGMIASRMSMAAVIGGTEAAPPDQGQVPTGDVRRAGTRTGGENTPPDSDALRRLGGMRGGGEMMRIPSLQLQEQRQANRYLQRIAHYAERPSDSVRDPETKALLRRIENYLGTGIDFETEF